MTTNKLQCHCVTDCQGVRVYRKKKFRRWALFIPKGFQMKHYPHHKRNPQFCCYTEPFSNLKPHTTAKIQYLKHVLMCKSTTQVRQENKTYRQAENSWDKLNIPNSTLTFRNLLMIKFRQTINFYFLQGTTYEIIMTHFKHIVN